MWLQEIVHLSQSQIFYMLESLTDILIQSFYKTQNFIKGFAQILKDNFNLIIKSITDKNILKQIEDIINCWADFGIYREDFKLYLLGILNNQRFYGDSNIKIEDVHRYQVPVYLNEDTVHENLEYIKRNKNCAEILSLQIEENNIFKYYNENINSHALDRYLKEHPIMNAQVQIGVNQCENICINFKNFIMKDLCRRELLLLSLSDEIEKKREEYALVENEKVEMID